MAESEAATTPDSNPGSPDDPSKSTSKKRNSKSSKPRLTPHQKNTNHKDAENKRRNAIRENFTQLSQLVPGAEGQERSEQVMLAKTKEYLQTSNAAIRELVAEAARRGIPVDENLRLREDDFAGPRWKQPHLEVYEKAKLKKGGRPGSNQGDGDDGDDDADAEVE